MNDEVRATALPGKAVMLRVELMAIKSESKFHGEIIRKFGRFSYWMNFWSGEKFDGGQTVNAAAPLEQMPLFVRAGSTVPLGPLVQFAGEKPADPLELRIYRGADGAFALYEDEGDNYNYEHGVHAIIPISWGEKSKTLTLGKRSGKFPGMLEQRKFRIVFVSPNHGIGGAVTENADAEVVYRGRALKISAK